MTLEKFLAGHRVEGDCWIWSYSLKSTGYGQVDWNGKNVSAHRLSYELRVGPIPEGMQLDHLCRNRACINPAHLEPVTQAENVARGAKAQKSHCIHGHALSGSNVYVRPDGGGRMCIACVYRRNRERYHRRKELSRR